MNFMFSFFCVTIVLAILIVVVVVVVFSIERMNETYIYTFSEYQILLNIEDYGHQNLKNDEYDRQLNREIFIQHH